MFLCAFSTSITSNTTTTPPACLELTKRSRTPPRWPWKTWTSSSTIWRRILLAKCGRSLPCDPTDVAAAALGRSVQTPDLIRVVELYLYCISGPLNTHREAMFRDFQAYSLLLVLHCNYLPIYLGYIVLRCTILPAYPLN